MLQIHLESTFIVLNNFLKPLSSFICFKSEVYDYQNALIRCISSWYYKRASGHMKFKYNPIYYSNTMCITKMKNAK